MAQALDFAFPPYVDSVEGVDVGTTIAERRRRPLDRTEGCAEAEELPVPFISSAVGVPLASHEERIVRPAVQLYWISVWISGYPSPMAKVLVSVDDQLLARIDRAASEAGLSRSAYLSRLAARELELAPGPGRSPRARRALIRLDRLFARHHVPEDATPAIRAERDAR